MRYFIVAVIVVCASTHALAGVALLTQERVVNASAVATATPDKPNGDSKLESFSAPDFGTFDKKAEAVLISEGDEHEVPTPFGGSASMQSFITPNAAGLSIDTQGSFTYEITPVDAKSASAEAIFKLAFSTDIPYRFSWRFGVEEAGGEFPTLKDQNGQVIPQTLDGLLSPGMYSISMDTFLGNGVGGLGTTGGYFIEFSTKSASPIPLPPAVWGSLPLLGLAAVVARKSNRLWAR